MDSYLLEKKLCLGKIKSIKRYKNGQHNQNFKLISDTGKYTLRIYNYKKPSQIKFEVAVLNHIQSLKVPKLVKIHKEYICKLDDNYAIVYHYIQGTSLSSFTKKQLHEVGSFVADFHNKGTNFRWDNQRYKFYDLPKNKINKFEQAIKRANVKYLRYLPKIVFELNENKLSANLPKGPIHVDIKPENVLFYRGSLSGVLDFDNGYIGPLLLDLAKTMIWFGTKNKKFDISFARHIYQGYTKKRKLSNLEYKELYKSIKFAFLSHIFVDYYMRAIKATTQNYFDFIIKDLYASYKTFVMSEEEFYEIF